MSSTESSIELDSTRAPTRWPEFLAAAFLVPVLWGCGPSRPRVDAPSPAPVPNRSSSETAPCHDVTAINGESRDTRPPFRSIEIGGAEGVIVPYHAYPDAAWTPGEAEIRMLESRLLTHLKAERPAESPDLYLKAGRYKRQYMGICEDGNKILYAFFMCEEKPGWKEQLIQVADGGDCYFSVHFDIASQQYLHVVINGSG